MPDEIPPNDIGNQQPVADHGAPPPEEAQRLGGAVLDQASDTPPTSERTYLGIDHSIDQLTGEKRSREEEPETRVQDETTAHEMASAGDFHRRRSADIRLGEAGGRNFEAVLQAIVEDPKYLDSSLRHRLKTKLQIGDSKRPGYVFDQPLSTEVSDWGVEELTGLSDRVKKEARYAGEVYRPESLAWGVLRGEDNDYELDRSDWSLERARRLDETAHREEEWARLLHEKPVQETYRTQHPDFDFGVNEMMQLEEIVTQTDGLASGEHRLREDLFDGPQALGLRSVIDHLEIAVEDFAGTFGREATDQDADLMQEYAQAITNGETTLSSLVDLRTRLAQRYNGLMTARAQERKQVLEDVKSGQAGQPPEPHEAQQAA